MNELTDADLDAIEASYRPNFYPPTFHAGDGRVLALVAEFRLLRALVSS